MTNPKGTAFETPITNALIPYFPHAHRQAKTGNKDKGDIGGLPVAIECKNVKVMALSSWIKQATVEAENAGKSIGVVVHKRKGVGDPLKQYATMELWALIELLLAYEERN